MSDDDSLVTWVEKLSGAGVLCIGEVMLDRYVTGQVERISPEAPIPVLRIIGETAMLGGAGNVVRNLSTLGAHAWFVSVVGNDEAGREVQALLNVMMRVEHELVTDPDRETAIKTRFLAGNQQMLRADRETVKNISPETAEQVLSAAHNSINRCAAVMISDYGKGVLSRDVFARLIEMARDAGKPLVVDPKGSDYSIYRGATVITPNRRELETATGMAAESDEAIVAAARKLIADAGVDMVLATRSGEGMTLVGPGDDAHHLAAEAREVFDVSGAGDTVAAAVSAALSVGAPMKTAAQIANAAAGIVVGKVGTATAYMAELIAMLHHQEITRAEAKVVSPEQMRDRIEIWKRQGLKVGFTNGCFDLLHPGHISLMDQARAACDKLVVGLNSDDSVRRLKGEDRPIQGEAARATVLASLTPVDAVVVFSEDTPLELIRLLEPDVLVKGADYTLETVVGADLVQERGGRIVLADIAEGHSTTATIRRLSENGG